MGYNGYTGYFLSYSTLSWASYVSSWSRRSFQQDILRNCQLRFEKCHFIWFAIEIENYLYWENIVKTLMINTIQKLFDIEVWSLMWICILYILYIYTRTLKRSGGWKWKCKISVMDINHKKKQYLGICKTCEAKENSESNWPIESSNDTYISNSK